MNTEAILEKILLETQCARSEQRELLTEQNKLLAMLVVDVAEKTGRHMFASVAAGIIARRER